MTRSTIAAGNNVPVQAPLIPHPFVPYRCPGNRSVYAVCRGDEAALRAVLEPTPFDYVEDRFVVAVTDFSNCDKVPYFDAAIVMPVRFGDIVGGHYVFEYEDDDRAIAAGRELWGYPKKYAAISLERDDDLMRGSVLRHGTTIMEIEVPLEFGVKAPGKPDILPHLNVRTVPAPDGPGTTLRQVIARDTTPDFVLKEELWGHAAVTLRAIPGCPLDLFAPVEVLGGGLVTGDFYATEENGWGRVVATLD
jgi:acetoacetate decarboxylase